MERRSLPKPTSPTKVPSSMSSLSTRKDSDTIYKLTSMKVMEESRKQTEGNQREILRHTSASGKRMISKLPAPKQRSLTTSSNSSPRGSPEVLTTNNFSNVTGVQETSKITNSSSITKIQEKTKSSTLSSSTRIIGQEHFKAMSVNSATKLKGQETLSSPIPRTSDVLKSQSPKTSVNKKPNTKGIAGDGAFGGQGNKFSPTKSLDISKEQENISPADSFDRSFVRRKENINENVARSGGNKSIKSTTKEESKKFQPVSTNPDFVSCSMCGRYFDPSRIAVHESICKKSKKVKRKPFDPVKHRTEGTELENYLKPRSSSMNKSSPKSQNKSNWRKKHEEFIANIRAAKVAQQHIAKGGKLSDLPPPPPLDTSDLIPCPHCGRKFNESAAERHIPKCANIINKPKPLKSKANKQRH